MNASRNARDYVLLLPVTVQFVLSNFAIECVAVNTKYLGGLGLISACLCQRSLNESFFKFV